jgi:L-ascorbate metabolism protein UlaG (beta-lactamase superfamily)
MDLQFYGANCIVLSSKGVRVVIDDNLAALGGKSVTKAGDIVLFTSALTQTETKVEPKLVIDHGGEYEVSDISIYGIPARGHMEEEGKQTATMYKLINKELSIFVPGHIYPELSDDQLEAIGMVDVMCIPVGGNGYTLDPVGALKVIKKIEPKIIVPTYYDTPGLNFEVPAQTLDQAITGLSMEVKEKVPVLKLKPAEISDITQLIVVEKS